jgi:hypothetical protein
VRPEEGFGMRQRKDSAKTRGRIRRETRGRIWRETEEGFGEDQRKDSAKTKGSKWVWSKWVSWPLSFVRKRNKVVRLFTKMPPVNLCKKLQNCYRSFEQ